MAFKSLLFYLFLYVCLVWVGAAYLYSGPKIQEFGLFWTAAGLTALLLFLIASRLWGWWRMLRAKTAAGPKPVVKPTQTVPEDDAALIALIAEANATLAKSPAYAGKKRGTPLSSLPLFLLIGPEGSGKTSTFVNSGLDPQLLAGQMAGPGPLISTGVFNLWLAKDALFVEIAGRTFSGDLDRFRQILGVLRAKPAVPFWRRLWSESDHGLQLRGVLAFCDVKEFMSASSSHQESLERRGREWQQRLAAVSEVFGVQFPVYLVITKSDAIPYFSDYFRRLPEPEINQVLGCTLPLFETDAKRAGEVFADVEAKRLTRSFSPLYHALAERRLVHLAHEPDPSRRAAIYEFPRELRRIRSSLVHFLVDVFRPHPLRPGPLLRGYYLTAIREGEVALSPVTSGTQPSGRNVGMEATGLFRADATRIFRGEDLSRVATPAGRSGATRHWVFVSELLHTVVLSDPLAPITVPDEPRLKLYRRGACAFVGLLCLVLCGVFFRSWAGNLELLHAVAASEDIPRNDKIATRAELQSLDDLRVQVSRLTAYERNGPPSSLRWGLYSGNRVATPARELYFRRFQELFLNNLNAAIVARLEAVPTSPDPHAPYEPVSRLLKAHLMISSGACTPAPAFASRVLKETRQETMPTSGSDWQTLADRQIEFYASELPYGNPCRVPENAVARDRARQYLRRIQGVDRIYSNILVGAEQSLAKPQRLGDLAANYREVLNGSGELSDVFSRDGWDYVEKASKKNKADALGEPCVVRGGSGLDPEWKQDTEIERTIQGMFVRDYIEHWRRFLMGFSVLRYGGPQDAARKLEILADHKSPLLALLAMISNQTNFPSRPAEPEGLDRVKPFINKVLPSLQKGEKMAALVAPANAVSTPADITRFFQPVHWVVPPGSETWVVDKNSAYIDALAELRHSMQEIARSSSNPDPAVHQAAGQNYEKALDAVRQIAKGFKPAGIAGLDSAVQRLLEAPIRPAQNFIIADMDKAATGKVNGELRALCTRLSSALRKYPFQSSGEDISLQELASWFAPTEGAIWKFQAQSLGEFIVKDGPYWKSKDPAKKPQVTQGMLAFLNRSQSIADAFYAPGATQSQLTYTLRPKLEPSFKDAVLELEVDGQLHQWTSGLQKQFTWPAASGSKDAGAIGRIRMGSLSFPFASRGGTWGIFRIMGDAESRPLSSKVVEWKYLRGGAGRSEPIQPAPVRLEIVEFPAGVDVFNPKFFEGLQCPSRAVQ